MFFKRSAMNAKKKIEVLTKLLQNAMEEQGITVSERLPWKVKQVAKSAGVSRKDIVEIMSPILHEMVDKGLKKPKGHHGGGH
jgi:hypothetical protein